MLIDLEVVLKYLHYGVDVVGILPIAVVVSNDAMNIHAILHEPFGESPADIAESIEVDILATIKNIAKMNNGFDPVLLDIWKELILKELEVSLKEDR